MPTLEVLLETTHQNIKLGTEGGGFLYCGNSDDVSFWELDKRNIVKKATYITKCKRDKRIAERRIRRPAKEYEIYVSRYESRNLKIKTFDEWLEAMKTEVIANAEHIESAVHDLIGYKEIGDRKVVATYPSITEDNTLIVVIEGNESGNYWTTEEYEQRKEE